MHNWVWLGHTLASCTSIHPINIDTTIFSSLILLSPNIAPIYPSYSSIHYWLLYSLNLQCLYTRSLQFNASLYLSCILLSFLFSLVTSFPLSSCYLPSLTFFCTCLISSSCFYVSEPSSLFPSFPSSFPASFFSLSLYL